MGSQITESACSSDQALSTYRDDRARVDALIYMLHMRFEKRLLKLVPVCTQKVFHVDLRASDARFVCTAPKPGVKAKRIHRSSLGSVTKMHDADGRLNLSAWSSRASVANITESMLVHARSIFRRSMDVRLRLLPMGDIQHEYNLNI